MLQRVIDMYFNNITVPQPEHLQASHKEADKLIFFYKLQAFKLKTSLLEHQTPICLPSFLGYLVH